jgi:hypothetical protein
MLRVAFSESLGANKIMWGLHHSYCTDSCQYKVAARKFQYCGVAGELCAIAGRVKKDGSSACTSLHVIPGLMIN